MSKGNFGESWRLVLAEVEAALAQVRAEEVAALEAAILTAGAGDQGPGAGGEEAGAIFVAGEGRSGLVARAFAMRLRHLGRRSYVAGETVTPAAGAGDVLLAVSGSGETRVTRARAEAAREAGVRVVVLTGVRGSSLARLADLCVTIPTGESAQYRGSLFEQSALVFFDALVGRLQKKLGLSGEAMGERHATLE